MNKAPIINLFNFLTLILKHTGVVIILLMSIYYVLMNTGKTAFSIKPLAKLVQINTAQGTVI